MSDVAFVHDYFVQDGGAERCAVELIDLLPQARVYTSFFDADTFGDRIDPARVHAWPLNGRVDSGRFRSLLPLYPAYFTALDLRHKRLVVSSTSAFAKAVRTSPDATHVSYVYTPMRFAWEQRGYLAGSSYSMPTRLAANALRIPLQAWDRWSARRPDVLVAISDAVRRRIRKRWRRDAAVIYPPVDVSELSLSTRDDGYLLVAARLLGYRRIDLAIEAAAATRRELVIVGDGPERVTLERLARATRAEVTFLGHIPRRELVGLFERCHSYLLPAEEDFGIAPVEAMAAGKPVVAFNRGGATETVRDGVTGVLFEDQSRAGITEALERADAIAWDPQTLRDRADCFDRRHFVQAWNDLLARVAR